MTEGLPPEQGAALPGVVGTKLEFFLNGFCHEETFQKEVQDFVSQHAAEFSVLCPDGSCPLRWTQLHNDYRKLFDDQVNGMIFLSDMEKAEFVEYCRQLHAASSSAPDDAELPDILPDDPECPNCRGIRASEFRSFFSALSASEDFECFQRIMFDAAMKQAVGAGQEAGPTTQELEVMVPEGMQPGQALAVDYLGNRYEFVIPEGCGPGSCFRASVALPM
eukprot:CAMPEP_0197881962 /NCGR_PEP_ID=MMETSP1439-20131203/9272_1 /TAXON_ID=66791 /ORGANISM="Gonyaulax spinifera, Strain CCMP409" /LENGTH=219 /DNA_ID=CAMNT_0043501599 /DNA_START=47 /DNA_END=706 /DNA_ORIENTATION=+